MKNFFKKRIHESITVSALFATALALHSAWIVNLFVNRVAKIEHALTLAQVGPISGMYLLSLIVFLLAYFLCALFFKGKDISHWRELSLWFFLSSIFIFLLMTLPFVYTFALVVE